MRKIIVLSILCLSLLVTSGQAAVTSLDYTFVSNDQYAADFYSRLNANFTKVLNGGVNSISTANILDDTVGESDMADEINPRIRTQEGAACEFVYTGLLPTTSASLTANTSAGTAYPKGYRINKSSSTSHSYTASKWTYVDIDQNGDFQYSEVAIGASTPSVATNSIRLARVSTDSTTVASVVDLRRTSCTNGPFSIISDATGEASLSDVLKNGAHVRKSSIVGRTPNGFAQGAFVSYDTVSTFKVTAGSLYINGKYRAVTQDITVPATAAAPSTGVSGIDTGSVTGGPLTYYVYGVADQDGVPSFSVSYSTSATTPTGATNYRLIGQITTDSTNLFTSKDVFTVHGVNDREMVGAWITFNGSGTVSIYDSYNISALADDGVGDYTISFDKDFSGANRYVMAGSCYESAGDETSCSVQIRNGTSPAAGSISISAQRGTSAPIDTTFIHVLAVGDQSK